MVDSYDVLVGRMFFPNLTAPYTALDYKTLDIPILSDRAKSVSSFLLDAKEDGFTVIPQDVPSTWLMLMVFQPIFRESMYLRDYPPDDRLPQMGDALDVICAVYGHRRIIDMIRDVGEIRRHFAVWVSEMHVQMFDSNFGWTDEDQKLYNIAWEVADACRMAEHKLWHNSDLIAEHARDLHAARYSEKRGSVTYTLGVNHYLGIDIWELFPDHGEGTVAFFCTEAFQFSDGGDKAIPLLPP